MQKPPDINFAQLLTSRPCDASIAAQHSCRTREKAINDALKEYFPHCRHDEQFVAALHTEMERTHQLRKSISWQACAYDIRAQLEYYLENPAETPMPMQQLCKLYPAYKIMKCEANADYNRPAMRFFGRAADAINDCTPLSVPHPKTKWEDQPDYWSKRVAALREQASNAHDKF